MTLSNMTLSRRGILKSVAAASAAPAAFIASGRAPAIAQTKTIHWVKGTDFLAGSDQLLRQKIVDECAKSLGIKLNIEFINLANMPARIASAIQSGTGPDIFNVEQLMPHLYPESVVDVTDVAESIAAAQGGFYPYAKAIGHDGQKWLAVPWATIGILYNYRKSWFAEIGYDKFPETWDALRDAGKKLKAKGRPLGQTLGQVVGDGAPFVYPLLWSFGGQELSNDGKTVALNSKETIESAKFMAAIWKEAFDETGFSWDNASNNRAFLANTISATINGASLYPLAKQKPESFLTETGKPLKDDIAHAAVPAGPAGRFSCDAVYTNMLMRYSKSQDTAKEFLKWLHSVPVYTEWHRSQGGYSIATTPAFENDPVWNADPVMLPLKSIATSGRAPGFAGPPSRKAAEAQSKFVLTDMYAAVARGANPEDAVRQAHAALERIYG